MGNESSTPSGGDGTGKSPYLEFFESAGETLSGAGGAVCGSLSDTLVQKDKNDKRKTSESMSSSSIEDAGGIGDNASEPNPMSELFARAILNEVTDNPNTMKESEMAQREKELLQRQKQQQQQKKNRTPKPIPMTPGYRPEKPFEKHRISIGLSLSRRDDSVGHSDTVTRQTSFDFNELQDRAYKYVSSTDTSGWRAGGGESGKCGQKNASPDTVCIPILELECDGEHVVDAVIAALARGDVFIPHMSVIPESLCVESRTSPPDLILKFGCERNEDTPPEEWPNWCLEFMHNQLYENFANCGAIWTRPFSITLAQKVRWKTVKHMNKYFRHSESVIQKWREAGPQYLEPQVSYIDGGATPEEVAKPHGIYLMRNGVPTNYFPPNLAPPYTTKMTRSLLYHVINKSWDKQKRDWTTQPIPRSVTPSMIFQTMCGNCNYPLSPDNNSNIPPSQSARTQLFDTSNHPHLADHSLNSSTLTQHTTNTSPKDGASTTSSKRNPNQNKNSSNRSRSQSPTMAKQETTPQHRIPQKQQQPQSQSGVEQANHDNMTNGNGPQHSPSQSPPKGKSLVEELLLHKETLESEDSRSVSAFEEDMALSQTQSMSVGDSHTTIPTMNGIMERERLDRQKRDAERALERKKVQVLEQALQLKLLKKKEKSKKKKKKKEKRKEKEKEKAKEKETEKEKELEMEKVREKPQPEKVREKPQPPPPVQPIPVLKSPPSLFVNSDSTSFSPTPTHAHKPQPQYFFADNDKPSQKEQNSKQEEQDINSQASLDYSLDSASLEQNSLLGGDSSLIGQQFAGDGSVVSTRTTNTNSQSLISGVTRTTVHEKSEEEEDDISLSILETTSSIETRVPSDEDLFAIGWAKAFDPNSNAYYYFTLDRTKIVWDSPLSDSNISTTNSSSNPTT